jgi:stress-induced morphogen
MGVLNHLGICTSYDTVRRALQGNAEKVQALIFERCRHDPISLTYDNLTNKHHAATETLLNKSSMQSFTAAGVIFLKLTPSLARRLGKDIDQSDQKPGLRVDQLLRPEPEWSSLKPGDIVNVQSDQNYFAPIAKALMCRVIKKFFPTELKISEDELRIGPMQMPVLFKVPPGKSDMQTLATLQIDESTIDGNLAVLESLANDHLGLTLEELAEGRMISVSGDQMTVARITSGQFLRVRDFKEHRMVWAKTLAGMLHTRMALIHAIYLSHPGRADGRDPASLSKFVKLLGRTKIKEKCPNLNASHELLTQVCEGHVLAALIARTGADGFEGLRAKIASGEWREALNSMVDDDWLRLNYVDRLRGDARQAAEAATADTEPVAGESLKQTQARIKKATTDAEMEKRDVVFENALLFMLQALIYTDYHTSLRSGDSGRLERSSDMLCVMFQGLSKLKNYRQISLDFKACREKEWTKEMRELWL